VSDKTPFVTRLLETAMRERTYAWAVGDLEAAQRHDKDVARLAAWRARLEPEQPAPLVATGYRDWHSLIDAMPWVRRFHVRGSNG
jgi:hypothetical protein